MGAEHMLLPRGGYDFTQVSQTEYRWSDDERNRSALVMAPEGTRFGWYYHVECGSPECSYTGRKSSMDAAFREAVQSLDSIDDGSRPTGKAAKNLGAIRRQGRRNAVQRLLDEHGFLRMARLIAIAKPENG